MARECCALSSGSLWVELTVRISFRRTHTCRSLCLALAARRVGFNRPRGGVFGFFFFFSLLRDCVRRRDVRRLEEASRTKNSTGRYAIPVFRYSFIFILLYLASGVHGCHGKIRVTAVYSPFQPTPFTTRVNNLHVVPKSRIKFCLSIFIIPSSPDEIF